MTDDEIEAVRRLALGARSSVYDMIVLADRVPGVLDALAGARGVASGLAERVAAQSDLLTKRAARLPETYPS